MIMRVKKITFLVLLLLALPVTAQTVTLTAEIGSYDAYVYEGQPFSVPVSVSLQGGEGSVEVTIQPVSGLSCDPCTKTITFDSSGTQSTSFKIIPEKAGTYENPFVVTASMSGVAATDSTSDTLSVAKKPHLEITYSDTADGPVLVGELVKIDAYYNAKDLECLNLTLKIPAGWELVSGSHTYNNICTTDGTASGAVSWTVRSLGGSSIFAIAGDYTNPPYRPDSDGPKWDISAYTPTPTPTPRPGVGPGVVATPVPEERKYQIIEWEVQTADLVANQETIILFKKPKMDVTAIKITPLKSMKVRFEVLKVTGQPEDVEPPGILYYYEIINANIEEKEIKEAAIQFKVSRSWIDENNVGDVNLARFKEKWTTLDTKLLEGMDGTYAYYEASTPGFSTFAIVGEEKVEVAPPPSPTPSPTKILLPTPVPPIEIPEKPKLLMIVGIVALVAALIVAGILLKRRRRPPEESKPE
jgi:PGF-pre-PGF domain-containing protein